MIDTIKITSDFEAILKSNRSLLSVNIVRYDKLSIQGQIDWSLVWLTKRNDCVGAGIIVELPFANSRQQNVSGPILDWSFPFLIVENPTINRSTGGTFLKYDTLCQTVMDIFHLYADGDVGTFSVSGEAMTPVEIEQFAGCLCFRVVIKATSVKNAQTPRTQAVVISFNAGECTLSSTTAGAGIFYTTDGSFPANQDGGSPSSRAYSEPFSVTSGQTIRAAAYSDGHNNSVARSLVVP